MHPDRFLLRMCERGVEGEANSGIQLKSAHCMLIHTAPRAIFLVCHDRHTGWSGPVRLAVWLARSLVT